MKPFDPELRVHRELPEMPLFGLKTSALNNGQSVAQRSSSEPTAQQDSCGTVEGHGTDWNLGSGLGQAEREQDAPAGNKTKSGYQAPPAGIHIAGSPSSKGPTQASSSSGGCPRQPPDSLSASVITLAGLLWLFSLGALYGLWWWKH